jgi:hypothetical protein
MRTPDVVAALTSCARAHAALRVVGRSPGAFDRGSAIDPVYIWGYK